MAVEKGVGRLVEGDGHLDRVGIGIDLLDRIDGPVSEVTLKGRNTGWSITAGSRVPGQ